MGKKGKDSKKVQGPQAQLHQSQFAPSTFEGPDFMHMMLRAETNQQSFTPTERIRPSIIPLAFDESPPSTDPAPPHVVRATDTVIESQDSDQPPASSETQLSGDHAPNSPTSASDFSVLEREVSIEASSPPDITTVGVQGSIPAASAEEPVLEGYAQKRRELLEVLNSLHSTGSVHTTMTISAFSHIYFDNAGLKIYLICLRLLLLGPKALGKARLLSPCLESVFLSVYCLLLVTCTQCNPCR